MLIKTSTVSDPPRLIVSRGILKIGVQDYDL